MPPKKDKGKKDGKQLQAVAQLNAVQATYKAACRAHGVPVDKALAAQIEDAIQDGGSAIDKVSLTGPDVRAGSVQAVLELMSGYAAVRNLGCWGCSLGSEGLEAIASFLRASGDRWWRGSRLRLLEVVADGMGVPLESWTETCMAHMRGQLAVRGSGHEHPNPLLDPSVPQVTPVTLQLQGWGLDTPTHLQLQQELNLQARIRAPLTSLMYSALDEAAERDKHVAAARIAAGQMTSPPLFAVAASQPRPALQGPGPNVLLGGRIPEGTAEGSQAEVSASAAPAMKTTSPAQESDAVPPLVDQGASTGAVPAVFELPPPGPQLRGLPTLVYRGSAPLDAGDLVHPLTGQPGPRDVMCDPAQFNDRQPLSAVGASPGYLAGHNAPTDQQRPMAFSPQALQALAQGLGSVGHGLQVLVLDHNQVGDLGMHLLATGLRRCSTLEHLSVSGCGLGHVAAHSLAAVLVPDAEQPAAPGPPKLLHLNASKNPFGGRGVTALCTGLECCTTLKVLNLCAVGLTEDDVPALEVLAATLEVNPSIDNVDLDCNFFGDVGAQAFLPMLARTKHMRKLRITAQGMTRAGGGELTRLVRENLPKAKGGRKRAAPKKK